MVTARKELLSFYGVVSGETTTYKRMKNFTEGTTSKNPKEYTRKYIDESSERTDVTSYSPSISYKFDYDPNNDVHKDIKKIGDDEAIGDATVREIIVVDLTEPTTSGGSSFNAIKRSFAVVPNSFGDDAENLTYSGDFKCNGDAIKGTATTDDAWQTLTFAADE